MSVQFVSAREAASFIKTADVIATGGFVGVGVPEEIHAEVEKIFLEKGAPGELTLYYAAGQGDGESRGLNHYGNEGMVRRVVGGHWNLVPKLGKLANENKIEAYNFPQGVISHMFRERAAGRSFLITHVGLNTFIDPDIDGGKLNKIAKEDLVKKVSVEGKTYLQYKTPEKIDVAIIRGTFADEEGNITSEKEALVLENLMIAMATKNSGGKVIVQVEKKVAAKSLNPKMISIPGIFVDAVVVVQDVKNHMQTFSETFNETYVDSRIISERKAGTFALDERKIIARQCALLFNKNIKIVNYGIGMPEGVSDVFLEENCNANFIPTVEPGAIGGFPAGGLSFGGSMGPQAIITQDQMFTFYHGGGIDMAILGLAQCDENGNINVSKFGVRIAGVGGFVDITQNAKEVIFCGTFTAGGLEIEVKEGRLKILKEGKIKKFIKNVEQISFSGQVASEVKKPVTYVTERAVFRLIDAKIYLEAIAPGIDLEKDVLALMDFKPLIKEVKIMDEKIFKNGLMGLKL